MRPEWAMRPVDPKHAGEYGAWERTALCNDCFTDTTPFNPTGEYMAGPWEWYMVHDHVWAQAGNVHGFLCIGCLERRLKRELDTRDFDMDLPVNFPGAYMTLRLLLRICKPAHVNLWQINSVHRQHFNP